MALEKKTCVPCQGGVPPLTPEAAEAMLAEVPGWELIEDATKLRRTFTFRNFVDAQAFASKVGDVSEAGNHHPDITFGWGYCTVVYFTHKIGGLHENDFIMAARVNALL
ncbi:MAG: 4a-hydroxytetrahydrobiopterin dehydratase [Mariprofundaceae bacterium]|nr:4a-hydroxytetrahydrobiopterin dehydratase [Mariprofundaceae bacterium]